MSVVNDSKEVDRFAVNLNQMMMYISFRQPGKNTIKTIIIYWPDHDQQRTANLRAALMERKDSGRWFKIRVLTHDDTPNFETPDYFDKEFHQNVKLVAGSAAEAEVIVDERFFAKKPFDWAWVNFWFETKPADQCQLRRRRFLAYTIQPIFAAAWYFIIAPVVKIIVTLALLLWGIRPSHISWKALWFLEPISDITYNVRRTSDWTRYKRDTGFGTRERNQPWWFFFFRPLVPTLVIAANILAATNITGLPLGLMVIALGVLMGLVIMVGMVGLIALAIALLKALWTKIVRGDLDLAEWEEHRRQVKRTAQQEAELRLARIRQQRLAALACDSDLSFKPALAALPPEKRTFHLRLQGFKAKVCRPFPTS